MGDAVGLRPARARVGVRQGAALLAALLLAGCAYFNALYNAQREYDDAERYAAGGERSRADQSFLRSAQKAAKSFEQDPQGRWADDALYLLARAHFHRRAFPEARAALNRLLAATDDAGVRAGALAYLGAAELRLGNPEVAVGHLDAALAAEDADDDTRSLAHLWRGRARAALGDAERGWADLVEAADRGGPRERDARLEALRVSVLDGDGVRTAEVTAALVERGFADESADTLFALADTASMLWGSEVAEAVLAPLERAPWPDDRRAALSFTRARFLAAAGDTSEAIAQAREAAARGAGVSATRARLQAARWILATSPVVDGLREARNILLPALADDAVRALIREVEIVGVLVETGLGNNQPLALFTAGEIARDDLGAPGIARGIFLVQAERFAHSPWSSKAALAAAQLDPPPDQRARIDDLLAQANEDPYVAAARGESPERYADLENQLGRMVTGLRRWGREEAERRDGVVLQTVLVMDSIRVAEVTDSLTVVCGQMLDSLAVEAGLLADSTLAACVRGDTARVDSLLRGDIDLTPDSLSEDTTDTVFPTDSADSTGAGGGGTGGDAAAAAVLRLGGFRPAR